MDVTAGPILSPLEVRTLSLESGVLGFIPAQYSNGKGPGAFLPGTSSELVLAVVGVPDLVLCILLSDCELCAVLILQQQRGTGQRCGLEGPLG